jgi:hypothetical protein
VRSILYESSFAAKARAFAGDMARRPGPNATTRRIEALAAARPSPGELAASQEA